MRLALQAQLQGLNPYLPTHLRFNEIKLPADQNKEALKISAQKIVKSLKNLHRRFLKKQIAETPSVLRKKLLSDKDVAPYLKELLDGGFEFAINRPENGRFWIEKVGFHNQHETGSSGGHKSSLGRNAVEASYLNKTTEIYSNFDNDLKPKYGYLLRSSNPRDSISSASWYGKDVYFFKKKNLIKK